MIIKSHLFQKRNRLSLFLLFLLGLVTAISEAAGVMSIYPLMSVISKPEIIHENEIIKNIYNFIRPENDRDFLIKLSVTLLLITILSLVLKSAFHYFQYKISLNTEYIIGTRLLENYLRKPYVWHLNKHSGELTKNILSQTSIVIAEVMLPAIVLVSHSMIVIFILGILIWLYPSITLITASALGIAYAIPLIFLRKMAARTGMERLQANELRFKLAGEILSGAKEIKIFQAESEFLKRFSLPAKKYAQKAAAGKAISILPKYILEGLAFGGFLTVIIYWLFANKNLSLIIPAISTFAVASYKLMPSLQQVYSSAMSIGHSWGAFNQLNQELGDDILEKKKTPSEDISSIKVSIAFDKVSFSFAQRSNPFIKDISITFPANKAIGLVGPSGSGKSTIVDLLSGLHIPSKGFISCDGKRITHSNLESWKKKIGYVPQNIFLLDDTVAANIAFGESPEKINWDRIEIAAQKANIHEFIVNELPGQYMTAVGERGVRLSGGQRQRIGLARALYKESEVVILDEATSALDNITEQVFMSNIQDLKEDHIVVIIAHRLSTIQNCDLIYYIRDGAVIACGSYQSLLNSSGEFKELLNAESKTLNLKSDG